MDDSMPVSERLRQQLCFVREIDAIKHVFRQTYLLDESRKENDAEHSWHLAMMTALLAEYATGTVDVAHVMKMVLIHDLVEIDAGDTFCYDADGAKTKAVREQAAAERIFNLLPTDQAKDIRRLWDEFESRETADAKFAVALDRIQPLMHNYHTEGRAWREHGVRADQVIERNRHIADGSPQLWAVAEWMIHDAVAKGWLSPAP